LLRTASSCAHRFGQGAPHKLDAAVDAAYSKKKFSGDSDRVAFLFELDQQILSPLESKKNIRRKKP
jgi:hypothetical protein